ncbi:DUF4912 domain-containing protein [Selenihalanaerobacter shriftii]|uniref:DUF4912 domain-containing protein n=1 Tax=Selenihalanaerobacter shriftii TaxID=142842 RepID=A0A1T4LB33_9FIRM|nr:DUF4912 domain-containing protein [Selenihalanaerobacter shriftii]SJZ51945.1 hypothetical protein SAMN02745118_01072 [Selenihalanaerobacter shriftii]
MLREKRLNLQELEYEEETLTSQNETTNTGQPKKEVYKEQFTLPEKYYVNKLVLQVKNPEWIYVYWEYTSDRLNEIALQAGYIEKDDIPIVLRVYDLTTTNYYNIKVEDDYNSWYLGGLTPNHIYIGELGILDKDNIFYSLINSNQVKTPANSISDLFDEEWLEVNEEIETIYRLSKDGSEIDNYSSIDFIKKIKNVIQRFDLKTGYSSLESLKTFNIK